MIHHEIFTARAQPELNEKSFTPSEDQLSFARKSLEQKRKISFGNQQILFCRRDEGQLMIVNEKVLEGARKKYMDFIKKNYNQKLSEELFHLNVLKRKIRELESRQRDEAARDQEETVHKKSEPAKKRGKEPKPVAGKKKVKEDSAAKEAKPNGKKVKKQASSVIPQLPELEVAGELEEAPSQIDSGELNLINSLSAEQFDGGNYDDE